MAVSKACHHCRKRRLRCDRSVPRCNKCLIAGRECPGYGTEYLWTNAVASRGHMAGKNTFAQTTSSSHNANEMSKGLVGTQLGNNGIPVIDILESAMVRSPSDPLFPHMGSTARFYLNYFSKRVCQELVVHDSAQLLGNPFRQLVAMSTVYPFLQHILVAASALHYSNVMHHRSDPWCYGSSTKLDAVVDALRARHKAIKSLQVVLEKHRTLGSDVGNADERDAMIATTLFFINFDLIDSGKGGWRAHMEASRALLTAQVSNYAPLPVVPKKEQTSRLLLLTSPEFQKQSTVREVDVPMEPVSIRDYIASDSVAYYIWGTALDCLSGPRTTGAKTVSMDTTQIQRILTRTEANSYHTCPAELLLLILRTSELAKEVHAGGQHATLTSDTMDAFVDLLKEAQDFDVHDWANRISRINSHVMEADELEIRLRMHAAATHRATACLYILLVAPGLPRYVEAKSRTSSASSCLPFLPTAQDFMAVILQQLSLIPESSPLFKYSTWPVFMTGVEASTPESRVWVLQRLEAMWDICPWGMLTAAMDALKDIWRARDDLNDSSADGVSVDEVTRNGSLGQLRDLGVEFLIV